jgi:[acyl-carrier-protein] S-malonyltransferase
MKKIAFLFPGQGSQYVGMGSELFDSSPAIRETFEEASDLCGKDIFALCTRSDKRTLALPLNNHMAIFTVGVAHFRALISQSPLVTPHFLAGHSLGEYTALTCGGALTFEQGLRLVRQRGQLLESIASDEYRVISVSNMPAVEVGLVIQRQGLEKVEIACHNSQSYVTVAGQKESIDILAVVLKNKGARIVDLNITVPVHTVLMEPAVDAFAAKLDSIKFGSLKYRVLSSVTSSEYTDHDFIVHLKKQLSARVLWLGCMEFLFANDVFFFVELGGGRNLTTLVESYGRECQTYPFRSVEDLARLIGALNDGPIYNLISKCLAVSVTTRSALEQQSDQHQTIVENYGCLQQIDRIVTQQRRMPSLKELEKSVLALKAILNSKPLNNFEKVDYLNNAVLETGTYHLIGGMLN